MCSESLILGILGGTAGFTLSIWTCSWLGVKAGEFLKQISNGALGVALDLAPDWHVFAWTAILSVLTGIAVGVLPALRAAHRDVSSELKKGTSRGTGAPSRRNVLLTVQVASCLILLVGAGLLFRGASRSAQITPGFDYRHLTVIGMDTRAVPGSSPARLSLQRQAIARLQILPGITSLAWADRVPFLGTGSGPFRNQHGALLGCVFNGVSDEYFSTVGIPLLAGRTFTPQEVEGEQPVAIISESTAQRLWPGQNPIGQRIAPATSWLRDVVAHQSLTVGGVAKTVRSTYLSKVDEGYVYLPRRLHDWGTLLLVRTRVLPERSFPALSAALAEINPNLPARTFILSLQQGPVRMQELMAQAPAIAASVLGALALLLACLGIYGVVSQRVSQRTHEIGVRIVLGASGWDVISLVGSQTLQPVAWGALAGLLGAFGISGLLRALIIMPDAPDLTYGAGAFDPAALLTVLALLAAVIVLAILAPLLRATRVEAAVTLRNE